MPKAIVIGVGPDRGLGAQLCHRFASEGLHVLVAGRTQENLDAVVANIEAAGGSAEAVVCDATQEPAIRSLLDRAGDELDLAVYNVGNNTPGRIDDMDASYFEAAWRICCFGGFLFGKEAIHHMKKRGGGTILYTGASASLRGRPGFGAFNSAKAALRILVMAMAKEYGADGIHVGHVVVDGAIRGEKVMDKFPEYADKLGEDGMINIEGIVDAFAFLYKQPRNAWSFEVDVRTSLESW